MSDLVATFSGEVMLAGWKETHTGGAVVSFFLPDPDALDVFRGMTVRKSGVAGHRFACVLVEIADDEKPATPPAPEKREAKPFGKQASELYRIGFFFNPRAMERVGTDQQYLDWLKTQPCCIRGSLIADKEHDGDVVPAHVRRIAAGAGTSIKPEYSAVPMCDHHHKLQHQHGESEVGGKDFMDDERARQLSRWMAVTCFGVESMGYVNPIDMRAWSRQHDIEHLLPEAYR